MPASNPQLPTEPLCLVYGDEDFLVRDRANQVYEAWCATAGGEDHEVIDGTVRNASEALEALAKLNEAVQTLPFFGGAKVVWLRAANFLGDERTASS
ncbi:MAG: DNA polymerase III subunit delta, partial [Verrucomicrobia bacterium]|nr:DNA polymerase III subunit delta [Verrucomicrobiota bacterium]